MRGERTNELSSNRAKFSARCSGRRPPKTLPVFASVRCWRSTRQSQRVVQNLIPNSSARSWPVWLGDFITHTTKFLRVEDLRGLMSALAIHNLRDRLARGRPDDQWLAELASHDQSAELIQESLEETLESMRPHNRRILELRMTGMEVDDISKETNRSRRTIERVLQNSCKSIIAVIPDSDPPES